MSSASEFNQSSVTETTSAKPTSTATTPFSMCLTSEERAYLNEHCGGRPWAAYIRECVFAPHAKPRKAVRRPRVTKTQQRQLTVKSSYCAYQANQLRHQRADITEILLKGKWLAQVGFQAGETVSVKVMQDCIVILKKE